MNVKKPKGINENAADDELKYEGLLKKYKRFV